MPDSGVKLVSSPGTNSGIAVRRDVGREQRAKRRLDRSAATERVITAGDGMAASAIGDVRQISAALDRSKILQVRASTRANACAKHDQGDGDGWPTTHRSNARDS